MQLLQFSLQPQSFLLYLVVPSPPTNRSLSGKSMKAKLLLDQLKSLRGKVPILKVGLSIYPNLGKGQLSNSIFNEVNLTKCG